ncbi:MAG: hypothetical protein ABL961_17865, partial [Vicinamibacterales bacterium]
MRWVSRGATIGVAVLLTGAGYRHLQAARGPETAVHVGARPVVATGAVIAGAQASAAQAPAAPAAPAPGSP